MRVLQLIDSLEAGGAERMAVNIANALSTNIDKSFLCATRKEGILKSNLNPDVSYLFLRKKHRVDFKAIKKLKAFIKRHDIQIIHAHSTSFFLATLIKILNKQLKIVWHDHYGNSERLSKRKSKVLRCCSHYFSHTICVNEKLKSWAKQHLKNKDKDYLPNFTIKDTLAPNTKLKGKKDKRIIHLANFRPQKDHINLLEAFKIVKKNVPDWTLHLVGKDFKDDYSKKIKYYIKNKELENHVFLYGSRNDISNILSQSTIGVLASQSEGLPIALLEYGLSKLPVVVTNVGDCDKVVSNLDLGFLVEPEDYKALSTALLKLIEDVPLRKKMGQNLYQKVLSDFSESSTTKALIRIYKSHLK